MRPTNQWVALTLAGLLASCQIPNDTIQGEDSDTLALGARLTGDLDEYRTEPQAAERRARS